MLMRKNIFTGHLLTPALLLSTIISTAAFAENTGNSCADSIAALTSQRQTLAEFSQHFKEIPAPGNVIGFSREKTIDLGPKQIAQLFEISKKTNLPPEQLRARLTLILIESPKPPVHRALRLLKLSAQGEIPYPQLRKEIDSLAAVFVSSRERLGFNPTELPRKFTRDQVISLYIIIRSGQVADVGQVYKNFFNAFDNARANTFLTFLQVSAGLKTDPLAMIPRVKQFRNMETGPLARIGFDQSPGSAKDVRPTLSEALALFQLQTISKIEAEKFDELVENLAKTVQAGDWGSVIENIDAAIKQVNTDS